MYWFYYYSDREFFDLGFALIFTLFFVGAMWASVLHDPLLEAQAENCKMLKTIILDYEKQISKINHNSESLESIEASNKRIIELLEKITKK